MPGLPVHHQLPEFTQTQVHRVGDAIQLSHPRSSPSPPAPQSLPESGSFPESALHMRKGLRDVRGQMGLEDQEGREERAQARPSFSLFPR
ncbi:unnamed protein product, partial [Rangifer tarandus platyrhynchus]